MRPVFFDITRLLVRGSRFTPTGIDRVVMAYARWLLAEPDADLRPVVTVGGRIVAVPRDLLARIVEGADAFSARGGAVADDRWQALCAALDGDRGSAAPLRAASALGQLGARTGWHLSVLGRDGWRFRPAAIAKGALYLNVSHTGLDQERVLAGVASAGAAAAVMVHDLIPITHPEYCAPGAEARHLRRMSAVLRHARLVVANSATTAEALASHAAMLSVPAPRTVVAPLGLEAAFLEPPPPVAARQPYFVALGTLEARKNLAFLLALWRQLAERLGESAPHLVLVGRRGWENESVLDHLQRSKAARRLVHEIADLQDGQVARLVGGARALLAPSLAEGYDLPVVEALSLGAPVIASDIPVHRELAAGAVLADPLDGPAWLAAIETALASPARPPRRPGPRWADHFATVRGPLLSAC